MSPAAIAQQEYESKGSFGYIAAAWHLQGKLFQGQARVPQCGMAPSEASAYASVCHGTSVRHGTLRWARVHVSAGLCHFL